jgi:uncharacterized protein YbjQ (UPF0145 family)
MGMCKGCNEVFNTNDMVDGYCKDCSLIDVEDVKRLQSLTKEEKQKIKSQIIVTTESVIDIPIEARITIASTQRVYGINIVKDIFGMIRDIVGGRVDSIETAINNATNEITQELKEKAFLVGGDAVIGLKIEHTYNNANNGSILSVFATGTVVKLNK